MTAIANSNNMLYDMTIQRYDSKYVRMYRTENGEPRAAHKRNISHGKAICMTFLTSHPFNTNRHGLKMDRRPQG